MGSTKFVKPVTKLRPKQAITLTEDATIQSVAQALAAKRSDACLIVSQTMKKKVLGIITDNDITRRCVAKFIDPETKITEVMTKDPKTVKTTDPALDALEMMVENHFRHVPVLDEAGISVIGLLDIAKCLYDAISALEKVQEDDDDTKTTDGNKVMAEAMVTAMSKVSGKKGSNKAQMMAMQAMMESMFGGSVPTLRTIIGDEHFVSVRESVNVREAATIMMERRKAVLVMDEDNLIGIVTPKDILNRVIAKGKSPDLTTVSSIMTPNPMSVGADVSLLDALREMHDNKFLHLAVHDEATGDILGLVDVMELLCTTAGGEDGKGWRDFFRGAMEARGDADFSDTDSIGSHSRGSPSLHSPSVSKAAPQTLSQKGYSRGAVRLNSMDDNSDQFTISTIDLDFSFKVTDKEGHTHKIKSAESFISLRATVAQKLGASADSLVLKYVDQEKDQVVITDDITLRDAVEFARTSGQIALKLLVSESAAATSSQASTQKNNTMVIVGGAVGVAAVLGILAMVFVRKR
jgi:CBS domain-containing protein